MATSTYDPVEELNEAPNTFETHPSATNVAPVEKPIQEKPPEVVEEVVEEAVKDIYKCICTNIIEEEYLEEEGFLEEEYVQDEECICEEREEKLSISKSIPEVVAIQHIIIDEEEEEGLEEEETKEKKKKAPTIVEEEVIAEEEEEPTDIIVKIDREKYLKELLYLREKNDELQVRSNILNNLLASYFTRKRMQHVLQKEYRQTRSDLKKKYEEKLNAYEEIRNKAKDKIYLSRNEILDFQIVLEEKRSKFEQEFKIFQNREKEVATGLKSSRTGVEIAEKAIDRFLTRQNSECRNLAKFRFLYIKAKNELNAKIEASNNLMKIGPGLTIDYYETLTLVHAIATDKIQEKEAELEVCREKCDKQTAVLSHAREKLDVTITDIKYYSEHLKKFGQSIFHYRENINVRRCHRDRIRKASEKLKYKNALAFNKDLLCDMYDTCLKVDKYKIVIEDLKASYTDCRSKVQKIREGVPIVAQPHSDASQPSKAHSPKSLHPKKSCYKRKTSGSRVTKPVECHEPVQSSSSENSYDSSIINLYFRPPDKQIT